MKVGSSPLYYLPGQEAMLENFVEHLNPKERQAFHLLKNEKILSDEEQTPVNRVALRAIKDFAIPLKVRVGEVYKIFWKHFSVNDIEFESLFREKILGEKNEEKAEASVEEVIRETEKEQDKKEETREQIKEETEVKEKIEEGEEQKVEEKKESVKKTKKKKVEKVTEEARDEETQLEEIIVLPEKKMPETDFGKQVKKYLEGRDIELIEVVMDKKKEFIAKIRTDHIFGKQEHFLIAKDKKNVSDNDLTVALQNAQAEKMPAIVMSLGELNKKGKDYIKMWNNLVKFEKLEF